MEYPPVDALTALSHRLIRQACRDDLDPFMVPGGEEYSRSGIHIRACFYYAVVVSPKTTVMFDNQGRGGMCDMAPHEIIAAWPTADLLASQGLSMDDLDSPPPPGALRAPLPEPLEVVDDLPGLEDPDKKSAFHEVSPGFAGQKSLTQLLREDPHLLITLVLAIPDHAEDPCPDPAPARPAPRMG